MTPALGRRRFLGLAAAALSCRPQPGKARVADLVVRGGSVLTLDDERPHAEAIAVIDGAVVAVGDDRSISRSIGPLTRVVDLRGGSATAGLVDAHGHLSGLGRELEEVDLRGAASIEDVVERLRKGAPPSGWVQGRGWDQNRWPGAAMPTHEALSAAFPDRPVWLRRIDGHAGWGNQALLRAAGIGRDTAAPSGGEILRDSAGEPTGVLVDAAMDLVPVPSPTKDDVRRWLSAGQRHALSCGLTGVHDMGVGPLEDEVYRELVHGTDEQRLQLRVHAYASESWLAKGLSERSPDPIAPDARYLLRGVKLYADGALGSRGAALLQPYADRPDHRGLMQHDADELRALVDRAVAGGWQTATHAIGDAANRATLDAYAAVQRARPGRDRRLRIEHCQIVDVADIARFAKLGVVASMQPVHATSDMPWVPARIGDTRLPGAYAWRRFLDEGVILAFGSDFPVELAPPTHGLHAALTRQDADGRPPRGWLPDQRLSLHEALSAFTRGAAWAVHRERHLGRLAPGMRADITCFASEIESLTPRELRDVAITATIVDGKVAFTSEDSGGTGSRAT